MAMTSSASAKKTSKSSKQSIQLPKTFASLSSSAKASGKKVASKNGSLPSKKVTMYHGTSLQAADCILRDGFRASRHGLLGKGGVYLTTDKSKAELYGPKLLTCSVDVGRKCCIDRHDHPDRLRWPKSCDTKWIPADAMHQWTTQIGEVYCVRDMSRVAIIDVQNVRCCPCSIADCRQCFLSRTKQQQMQMRQAGKGKDKGKKTKTGVIHNAVSHSEACCSQVPSKGDSDSSGFVSDGKVEVLALVCGSQDDSRVDAVDPWELHWQACQSAEKVAAVPLVSEHSNTRGALELVSERDGTKVSCATTLITVRNTFLEFRGQSAPLGRAFSAPSATHVAVRDRCSNGLVLEEDEGQMDGSSTTVSSGISDDGECRIYERRSKRW